MDSPHEGFGSPTGHRPPRDSTGVEALLRGYGSTPHIDQSGEPLTTPVFYFLGDTSRGTGRRRGPRFDSDDEAHNQSRASSRAPSPTQMQAEATKPAGKKHEAHRHYDFSRPFGSPTGHRLSTDSTGVEALLGQCETPQRDQRGVPLVVPLDYYLEDTSRGTGRLSVPGGSCRKLGSRHVTSVDSTVSPPDIGKEQVRGRASSCTSASSRASSRGSARALPCRDVPASSSKEATVKQNRHDSNPQINALSPSALPRPRVKNGVRSGFREANHDKLPTTSSSNLRRTRSHDRHIPREPLSESTHNLRRTKSHDRHVSSETVRASNDHVSHIASKTRIDRSSSPKRAPSPQPSERSYRSVSSSRRSTPRSHDNDRMESKESLPPQRGDAFVHSAGLPSGVPRHTLDTLRTGSKESIPPRRGDALVHSAGRPSGVPDDPVISNTKDQTSKLEELDRQLQKLEERQLELAARVTSPASITGEMQDSQSTTCFGSSTGHRPPRDSSGVGTLLGDHGGQTPPCDQYGKPLSAPLFYHVEDFDYKFLGSSARGNTRSKQAESTTAEDMQRQVNIAGPYVGQFNSAGAPTGVMEYMVSSRTPDAEYFSSRNPKAAQYDAGAHTKRGKPHKDMQRRAGEDMQGFDNGSYTGNFNSATAPYAAMQHEFLPKRQSLDDIIAKGSASGGAATDGSSSSGRFVWPWSSKESSCSRSSAGHMKARSPSNSPREIQRILTPPLSAQLRGKYGMYLREAPSCPTLPIDDPIGHPQLRHYRQALTEPESYNLHLLSLRRSHAHHLAPSDTWMHWMGSGEWPADQTTAHAPAPSAHEARGIPAAGKLSFWRQSQVGRLGKKACAAR
eukprot:gnl/MRDRNA2_/MRDRNA2_106909_c0_seq1.p1 gnl/MRDRNA2_/MRDRNA2_106909_c0~~gnl/MRDRNA2_/MRDRNA2_106909_c0_seq1.p1  ORF type:complete len:848 (-),score=103.56 gnl/MRDRNA2_/MRDRNA2_106909_c0_seq1:92-2635(-)